MASPAVALVAGTAVIGFTVYNCREAGKLDTAVGIAACLSGVVLAMTGYLEVGFGVFAVAGGIANFNWRKQLSKASKKKAGGNEAAAAAAAASQVMAAARTPIAQSPRYNSSPAVRDAAVIEHQIELLKQIEWAASVGMHVESLCKDLHPDLVRYGIAELESMRAGLAAAP